MQYKLVYTAKSIIERDALSAFLKKNCIPVQSPARDLSRKYTEDSLDLSLGGYSLFFDGFKIFVPEEQEAFALEYIDEFKKGFKESSQLSENTSSDTKTQPEYSTRYAKKFYYCSLISIMIPIIPLFYGLYFLYKAKKYKNKFNFFYSLYAAGAYTFSLFVIFRLGSQLLKDYGLIH